MQDWTKAEMALIPECDYCDMGNVKADAAYDGATIHGPWAYMCESHFASYGKGLGLGKGQRLVLVK